jgi:hypothetical protein
MFNAAIINLFTGGQVVGRSVDYKDINEGMRAMERLSFELTSTAEEITQRDNDADRRDAEARRKAEWDAYWEEKKSLAKRNTYEPFSMYYEWGDEINGVGGSLLTNFHASPIPYLNFGLETRLGLRVGSNPGGITVSGSPMLGLIFPIIENVKLFGDAMLEFGYFAGIKGKFTDWITPAFDAGILFLVDGDSYSIDIKYRGTWFVDSYVHSIGFGFGFNSDFWF